MTHECESCEEDTAYDRKHTGCRANEATCIDGVDCPDYVEHCSCQVCSADARKSSRRGLIIG